jgi:anti-sigma factor ChrR (cupin superfamily)
MKHPHRNPEPAEPVGKVEPQMHTPAEPPLEPSVEPIHPQHPDPALLEAFAAGELEGDAVVLGDVRAHLAACPGCTDVVEGWQVMFEALGALPEAAPSEAFAARVMARFEADHLSTVQLFDWFEGALPEEARSTVAAHLASCTHCDGVRQSWSPVFEGLAALEAIAPPAGFADRVMVRWAQEQGALAPASRRVPASSLPGKAHWIVEGARTLAARLTPKSTRGWAVAGGLTAAPALAVLVVVGLLLAHPLLSADGLLTYAIWQISDALSLGLGAAVSALASSPITASLWSATAALMAQPPLLILGAAAALGGLLASAFVVLYRNILVPAPRISGHVQTLSH